MNQLVVPTFLAIAICLALYRFSARFPARNKHSLRSVAILVLGDIGRSPRMMYHAESFAENGFRTHIIGFKGSRLIPSLETLPLVDIHHLWDAPSHLAFLPFVFYGPIKVVHQIVSIFFELLVGMDSPPEFILVQNPPSIPTLAVVWIVSWLRGCKVIIDWHNLGYTILALKLGSRHPLVWLARWFESYFGRSAYAHLFVTQALRDHLVKEWNLQGINVVFYDRPPRHFHHATSQEVHELFQKLDSKPFKAIADFLPEFSSPYSTPLTDTKSTMPSSSDAPYKAVASAGLPLREPTFTEVKGPYLRPDRPAVIVSSTSWTADEDFGLLFEALQQYEARASQINTQNQKTRLPKLLVIVTGKGPQRDHYMDEIKKLQVDWKWVRCLSLWLEASDYPVLLGSADLGISLHSSSSKKDLPMKIVDMFGCSLPVLALRFECLHELVQEGANGLLFENSAQLTDQLVSVLSSFPDAGQLQKLRASIATTTAVHSSSHRQNPRHVDSSVWCPWDENWSRHIRPLVLQDVHDNTLSGVPS